MGANFLAFSIEVCNFTARYSDIIQRKNPKTLESTAPIITLTSDFGWRDYHLALIKGALLHTHSNVRLADISHDISNYNILQAAFIFANSWRAFPTGTIHVVSVNDRVGPDTWFVLFAHEGHYFTGPDNGLFSLVLGERPKALFRFRAIAGGAFPLAQTYAHAVAGILSGKSLSEVAEPAETWEERLSFQPIIGQHQIRGSVIYIDKFDNVILNISRSLFEQVGQGRPFSLYFKRHDPITRLVEHFQEAPIGETLCRFNSANLLEIAIHMGQAATLLGLKEEDSVQIDFIN